MIRFDDFTIDRRTLTITRGDYLSYTFKRQRLDNTTRGNVGFAVLEALLISGGVSFGHLLDAIYDKPNGGPLGAPNIFSVILRQRQLKKAFSKLGLQLKVEKIAGVRHFRAVPV